MDKSVSAQKSSALQYLFTILALIALSAIIVASLVAFRSVDGVYYDMPTLLSAAFLIFVLLWVNYMVLRAYGRGDGVSTVFVFSTVLLSVISSIICLHFDYAYALPIAFLPLLLGMDFHKKSAIVTHFITIMILIVCMVFFAYQSDDLSFAEFSLRVLVLVVNAAGGVLLISLIKPFASRLKVLLMAVLVVVISGLIGFFAAAVLGGAPDVLQMLTVGVSVMIGGAISIFAYFCLTPLFERVFNLNTGLRLVELCSFNQPLLKELEEKAPGTFNHSLTVANLAERAAYAIGEDPRLAKAAALYHDIGKIENPEFFTENQTDGYNPHDDLIPEVSVKMITRHTEAGAKILSAKGFPKEIISAAVEHHGDSPVGYFYHKAQTITEGTLAEKGYTYVGPKPQTKINAIIMIADICEAATRSVRPSTREELEQLVDKLVRQKMTERQFDECPITMAELTAVKVAVVNTLMGVHHERISYNLTDKK